MLLSLSAYSQNWHFENISVADGLPTNEIYDLLEDKAGRIYIATNAGLVLYTSGNYKLIFDKDGESPSLTNLKQSSDGRVFCMAFDGRIFEVVNNELSEIYNLEGNSRWFPAITITKNDLLAMLTNNTIFIYDIKRDKLIDSISVPYNTSNLFCEHDNNLMFYSSTLSNIIAYNLDTYKVDTTFIEQNKELKNGVFKFFLFNGNTYFINAWKMAPDKYYFLNNRELESIEKLNNILSKQQYISNATFKNQLFLSTTNGIFIFDSTLDLKSHILEKNVVSRVIHTKENMLWVSTTNNGLFVCKNTSINKVSDTKNVKQIVYSNNTLNISNSNGELVARNHKISSANFKYIKKLDNKLYGLKDNQDIVQILPLSKTIATPYNPIDFDIITNNQNDIIALGNDVDLGLASSFQILNDGYSFINKNNNYFKLSNERTHKVHIDKNKNIWGLQKKRALCFKPNNTIDTFAISGTSIAEINNKMWIGSRNKAYIVAKNKIEKKLLIGDIVIPENVLKIIPHNNSVYIQTNRRMLKLNSKSYLIEGEINPGVDIPLCEILDFEIFKDSIYMATSKGLYSFPMSSVSFNLIIPKINIKSVSENDKEISQHIIKHDFKNLHFLFDVISPKSFGSYHIHYKLNTEENYQTLPMGQNSITFNDLSPSKYHFTFKVVNEDGISSSEVVFPINIIPPFYQTSWFYIGISVLVILVITLIYSLRIKAVRKKLTREKLIKSSEIKAIKSQMNPHFIFNALNSIQDLILKKDVRGSNLFMGKFSTLVREVLYYSGKDFVSIDKEIEILNNYLDLEKLRFKDDFNYVITTNISEGSSLEVPSLFIQPYVENAIKHGLLHREGNKTLLISFNRKENIIICTIDDNGVGREKSAEINQRRNKLHKSFATEANAKRIELLNDILEEKIEVSIIDKPNHNGTTVLIKFPINNQYKQSMNPK